jgi:hypothetical protein
MTAGLRGSVELDFASEGVRCDISIPLSENIAMAH